MNRKEKIENEINKTLDLFEQKEVLKFNPYFYTRVKQRIDEKSENEFSFGNILKPAFFTMLVILNLTTAIWYTTSNNVSGNTKTDTQLADVLKSDFNLESDQIQSLIFE